MERLMGEIIDVDKVQKQLDRAAHDAKHGPSVVRAGRFVHRDPMDGKFTAIEGRRTRVADNQRSGKEKRS
jgi:hypothetical protein